jgi:hypothetical protein
MKLKTRLLIPALILFGVVIYLPKVSAANQPITKLPPGITVSPAFQQANISADEPQHQVTFKITNNESTARTFDLSVQDFNTLGESGGLFFVGTNPTELQKKYGLAKWLEIPQKSITLQPKQTQTIQAQILNLPDLSPGGHYGALMLQAQSGGSSSGNNKVSVRPIASSLLFVTKIGGDTHRLSLASVSFNRTLFSLPSSVSLRFHNDGNTHVVPRGNVYIRTANGKLVSRGTINENSNIVLPETYRQINVSLQNIGGFVPLGKHSLYVDFRFDGIDIYRSYRQDFYVLQLWAIVLAILVLGGIGASILWFKKRKK